MKFFSKIMNSHIIQIAIISVIGVCIIIGSGVILFAFEDTIQTSTKRPSDNTSSNTSQTSSESNNSENTSSSSSTGNNTSSNNQSQISEVNPPSEPPLEDMKLYQWYDGTDISQRDDFDPDNVAIAINNQIASMQPGDKAYLPYGSYKYTETIKIVNKNNNLKDCQIVLDGIYTQPKTTRYTAMEVEGENLRLMVCKITNKNLSHDYSITRASGIIVGKSLNCNYYFKQVIGFQYGIKLEPSEAGEPIKDNNINFNLIHATYPIYMKAADGVNGRVSGTNFSGGRIRGKTGVTMLKGDVQQLPHENNTFGRVAWESIETYGINAQFATKNMFYANRFESVMGYQIIESELSSENRYYNSVDLKIGLLDIKSKNTRVDMPIFGCYPIEDKQNYWQDLIRVYETDSYGRPMYTYFEKGYQSVNNENLDVKANTANLVVGADTSDVNLKLHWLANDINLEMFIYVSDSTKTVKLTSNDGTIISSDLEEGTYCLTYDGIHRLEKISDTGIL